MAAQILVQLALHALELDIPMFLFLSVHTHEGRVTERVCVFEEVLILCVIQMCLCHTD